MKTRKYYLLNLVLPEKISGSREIGMQEFYGDHVEMLVHVVT